MGAISIFSFWPLFITYKTKNRQSNFAYQVPAINNQSRTIIANSVEFDNRLPILHDPANLWFPVPFTSLALDKDDDNVLKLLSMKRHWVDIQYAGSNNDVPGYELAYVCLSVYSKLKV